jgi:hypothetical protein
MSSPEGPNQGSDSVVLERVNRIPDFFGSALLRDDLKDWELARDFGAYLLRIDTDQLLGRLLLARAYRHLGDHDRAIIELTKCKSALATEPLTSGEREVIMSVLEREEAYYSAGP